MSTILSPNRYTGRQVPIRVIVIHTMEVDETSSVAEVVGNYFAKPATKASAHVGVDTDSTCRYVADADTAWAAPGANADGLQLELAGRAGQTTGQWTDAGSEAILERAAQVVATWARIHAIPVRQLTDDQLRDGVSRGIVGHNAVSRVFKRSNHWDPGPSFPWASFLARVQELGSPIPAVKFTPPRTLLTVNGTLDTPTRKRLQQWVGVTADGVLGPVSMEALRVKVGATRVGYVWLGLQRIIGVTQDNRPGPVTYTALQRYLNQR